MRVDRNSAIFNVAKFGKNRDKIVSSIDKIHPKLIVLLHE